MKKRSSFHIVTILILCWKASEAGNQTILKKNIGDDVLLTCELGFNLNSCEWFRDGRLIIPDQKRYTVETNGNQRLCLLKIAGALEKDSGYYTCHSAQISDNNPEEHGTALVVQEHRTDERNNLIHLSHKRQRRASDDFVIIGQPEDTTAKLGDTIEMRCKVNQISKHVIWMHGLNPFVPDGTHIEFINSQIDGDYSIRINNVIMEDNGNYQCKVPTEGEQSGASSQWAKLTILYAPKVPIITCDGSEIANGGFIEVAEGATNIVVECTVSGGNPAADIEWILNGASLGSGNTQVRPSTENANLHTISSSLNLTSEQIIAGNSSRTNLYCRSSHQAYENKPYEETYAVIALPGLVTTVNLLQNQTKDSTLSVYPGEYVTLFCTADGMPPPEFWWQKFENDFWVNFTNNGADINGASGQNITFKDQEGEFICVAKNKYNKYDNGIKSEPFLIQFLDDSGLSVGGIIGVVFGSIAFVVIIIIIVLICYKKRKCCFRSKIEQPNNPSYANRNTVNMTQSNGVRISSPVLQNGHSNSGNNSPQSTSSHGNNKPSYATVLPKNRTRTNRNPSQFSELEEEYIKTLDKHHSELHGTPKSQKSNYALSAREISMRSSLSSDTSSSLSESSLQTTHNHARPISIIGRQTPTTSIHSRHLDQMPETPIEYHLTNGEKIQFAIVKQQSDV